VFKIINDVEHAWNNQENLMQKIDSICLEKFQYSGSINLFSKDFTWFTKKGQFVCWRYKYIHEGNKNLILGFPNAYRRFTIGYQFCLYSTSVGCNATSAKYPQFQILFPMVNDTVIMRLSAIRPDMFKSYK
jgi:hypothetical protein